MALGAPNVKPFFLFVADTCISQIGKGQRPPLCPSQTHKANAHVTVSLATQLLSAL